MLVNFSNFQSADNCGICWEAMEGTDSIAHSGGGEKHPMHKECLKTSLVTSNRCPFCRALIDAASVISWKDRAVKEIISIKKDAVFGFKIGATTTILWPPGLISFTTIVVASTTVGAVVVGALIRKDYIQLEG